MRKVKAAKQAAAATVQRAEESVLRIDLMKVVREHMPWPFTDAFRSGEEGRGTAYAIVDAFLPQVRQEFEELAAGLPVKKGGKRRGKIIDVRPVKAAATRAPKPKKKAKVRLKTKRRVGQKK